MTPRESLKICFSKYADFGGRASLSEYWWFFLITSLVPMLVGWTERAAGFPSLWSYTPVEGAVVLATIIPFLAVTWRRYHDAGRPGWHIFVFILSPLALWPGFVAAFFFVTSAYIYVPLLLIGAIIMIALTVYYGIVPLFIPTRGEDNQWGAPPELTPIW